MLTAPVLSKSSAQVELYQLGLTEGLLRDAVLVGERARNGCTRLHPAPFPGLFAWAEMIRHLREQLIVERWRPVDDRNCPVIVNPSDTIVLTLMQGDDATGIGYRTPRTKSAKGPVAMDFIDRNRSQLALFDLAPLTAADSALVNKLPPQAVTWVLLTHRNAVSVNLELSLPSEMDVEGRVVSWSRRIILNPVMLLEAPMPIVPDVPAIDIAVTPRVRA